MAQLRVYRSFIKKAADEGKHLIIWDESRRYEGSFKGFDPQGEFLILTDVKIRDSGQIINSPEILIPIETIKVVSSETEEDKSLRIKMETVVAATIKTQEAESAKTPASTAVEEGVAKPFLDETAKPGPTYEKASFEPPVLEPAPEATIPAEETVPEVEETPAAEVYIKPESEIEVEGPVLEKEKEKEGKETAPLEEKMLPEELSEVPPKEQEFAGISSETRALIEELTTSLEKKETAEAKREALLEITAGKPELVEETPAAPSTEIETIQPAAVTKEEATASTSVVSVETSQIEEKLTKGAKAEMPPSPVLEKKPTLDEAKAPEALVEMPDKARVISEKSKTVSRSPFFATKKDAKASMVPRRRLDIGTLILDIMIVILAVIAVLIAVVAIFRVKLPFF